MVAGRLQTVVLLSIPMLALANRPEQKQSNQQRSITAKDLAPQTPGLATTTLVKGSVLESLDHLMASLQNPILGMTEEDQGDMKMLSARVRQCGHVDQGTSGSCLATAANELDIGIKKVVRRRHDAVQSAVEKFKDQAQKAKTLSRQDSMDSLGHLLDLVAEDPIMREKEKHKLNKHVEGLTTAGQVNEIDHVEHYVSRVSEKRVKELLGAVKSVMQRLETFSSEVDKAVFFDAGQYEDEEHDDPDAEQDEEDFFDAATTF